MTQQPTTPAARRHYTVFAAVAAFLAAVLGFQLLTGQAASAKVTTHARTTQEARIAKSVLTLLNAERRAHHLKPLASSSQLQLSARRHDVTMSKFNVMSHQLPREAAPGTRIRSAGYKWRWAGENIAWNAQMSTAGVKMLENLMYREKAPNDGHRLNILSSHFRNVGVAVYMDRAHHKVWLTTDFGAH